MNRLTIVITTCIVGCCTMYGERVAEAIPRAAKVDFRFKGTASGGTLIFGSISSPNSRFVSIETVPGESAESVVYKLAKAIVYSDRLFKYSWVKNLDPEGVISRTALGNTLRLTGHPGMYFLAGTEKGLGIPEPPVDLSCSYDEKADEILCNWINPPGGYDHVVLVKANKGELSGSGKFDGHPSQYKVTRRTMQFDVNDFDLWVMGLRGGVMSSVAAIHLSGNSQVELSGIPFTNGLGPNWSTWSTATSVGPARFVGQGQKHANLARGVNRVRALLTKPFYQVIKAGSARSTNGVYRRFLGLAGGHTYRINACLTTLEMDSVKGDWSFGFCAAHNGPDGKDLTVQQMAGLAALPNGSSGPTAGRIVSYSKDNTTNGEYELVFTGDENAEGTGGAHITLPQDVNTITVWVRFSCSDPNGKVGLSGVRLEDITDNANVKTPQDIIQQETAEEAKVLRLEQKALQRINRQK